MHGLIRDRLEEYLRCGPGKKISTEFEEHLGRCEACREEVGWMREQSGLLRALAAPAEMDPAPGFYARVMARVESRQVSSIWSVLLEPAFGRRLLATSLTLVMLLGAFLAYTEAQNARALEAEAIMAVEEHPPGLGTDRQRDREATLATLATYRE